MLSAVTFYLLAYFTAGNRDAERMIVIGACVVTAVLIAICIRTMRHHKNSSR